MGFDPCRFRFFYSLFFFNFDSFVFFRRNHVHVLFFSYPIYFFKEDIFFFLQDQIPEFFTIVFRSRFSISFRFYDKCYIYQIKMFERHNLLANRFEIIKEKFNKRTC